MLEIKNLNYHSKNFSLKDISLSVGEKEYFVLLGPTGSGKTLLLKNIAGLVTPQSQCAIFLDGKDISLLPTEERSCVYLAQDYRLFPHLNVRQNILFSPRLKNISDDKKEEMLKKFSSLLGIDKILERKVDKLSGGEKQRVALARALASSPMLILLDEPFSAIDTGLKRYLWFEIKTALISPVGKSSVIHVTHDIEEAMTMGDKVAVIIDGRIAQMGDPSEILLRPATESVARYLGIKNIYPGKITNILSDKNKIEVDCSGEKLILAVASPGNYTVGEDVRVCVRPQSVKIIRPGEPLKEELKDNVFEGKVVKAFFFSGESASIFVKKGNLEFEARFPQAIYKRYSISVGKEITFALWQPDVMVYRGKGE